MELIERYLQAIGRLLPRDKQEDILKELRSSIYDALDDEGEGLPEDKEIVILLKEMGSPRDVAAAYYPTGQYLIGPTLYPFFVSGLKIVLVAVISVQLVFFAISFAFALDIQQTSIIEEGLGIFTVIPTVLGWVVLSFWLLQRAEIKQSELDPEGEFNPYELPQLEPIAEPVNRTEQILSVVARVIVLSFLLRFAQSGTWFRGEGFFENSVIEQYLPWIVATTVVGLGLDLLLLWRGRWERATRVGLVGYNLFCLGVLYLLLQGHNALLAASGVSGMLSDVDQFIALIQARDPLAYLVIFRMGLAIAAVVTLFETIGSLYKLIRMRRDTPRIVSAGLVSANQ
jgi:hypothetical protein